MSPCVVPSPLLVGLQKTLSSADKDKVDCPISAIAASAFRALQAPGQLLTRADSQDSSAEGQSLHQRRGINCAAGPWAGPDGCRRQRQ